MIFNFANMRSKIPTSTAVQNIIVETFSHPNLSAACREAAHRAAGVTDNLARVGGNRVPGGVVHTLPADLREALIADTAVLAAWNDITPLARNEFICWVEDAKQQTTRERRIRRTREELEEGQRRPCCWPGCKHRERNGRPGSDTEKVRRADR
jgi:hypothetical protein